MNIERELFRLQDKEYQAFQSKLIPTVPKETVIGVRTPELRKLAVQFAKEPEAESFLQELPHRYYEENNLHAFLIERIRDYDRCIAALDSFLPYIDNWATCDCMSPKVLGKHLPELLDKIREWMDSGKTYTVRYGIGLLMRYYLDDVFTEEYPGMVAGVHSDEYYINMMIAWYFATALAKQYEQVIPYFEEKKLDIWIHNKAIQKAIESRRITKEKKEYLRSLKRKE